MVTLCRGSLSGMSLATSAMTNFVIGREAFFLVGNDQAASLCAHQ